MHTTHSRRPRTRDISWRSERWPDSRLRTRRLGRDGPRLPREPGRRFSQEVALDLQRAVLATEALQLHPLLGGQRLGALATIRPVLKRPVANGLLRRLELFRQLFRPASSTNEGDDLLTIGRRIGSRTTEHQGLLLSHGLYRTERCGNCRTGCAPPPCQRAFRIAKARGRHGPEVPHPPSWFMTVAATATAATARTSSASYAGAAELDYRPSYLAAAIAGLVTFILYLVTLAPTTSMWDTSEYIAAAYVLGLPHPPGNPFFVLIGRVFAVLPIGPTVAIRINVLAALSSAISAALWFLVTERVLVGWMPRRWQRIAGGSLAVLIGATAFTVWNQSVVNEKVYTVSLVGLAVICWLTVRWCDDPEGPMADRLLVLPVVRPCIAPVNAISNGSRRGAPTEVCVVAGRLPADHHLVSLVHNFGRGRRKSERSHAGRVHASILGQILEIDAV